VVKTGKVLGSVVGLGDRGRSANAAGPAPAGRFIGAGRGGADETSFLKAEFLLLRVFKAMVFFLGFERLGTWEGALILCLLN